MVDSNADKREPIAMPVPPPPSPAPAPASVPDPSEVRPHPFLRRLGHRVVTIIVTWNVVVACLFGTFFVLGVFGAAFAMSGSEEDLSRGSYADVYGDGSNEFLSIPITGTIMGSSENTDGFSSIFSDSGYTYGYDVKDQLHRAADDTLIKGVILEIDSPGGTIYGSKAIEDGVRYYREKTGQPVYAHIEGTGASGAYWAAVSADKLFADYGSATGSVGVIMGPFEYYDKVVAVDGGLLGGGVVTQNGVESTYLTAGKSKDVGNPFRRLTTEEVGTLQKTINNEYDGFVQHVSERRGIDQATIRNSIGAMVYDPKTAKELKLIDEVGSRQDAYAALAKEAKIEGEDYRVIREQYSASFMDSLLGVFDRTPKPKAKPVDTCKLTHVSLVYYGDVSALCSTEE